jgi:hypothetical protein
MSRASTPGALLDSVDRKPETETCHGPYDRSF